MTCRWCCSCYPLDCLHENLCSRGFFIGIPWGEMMMQANIPLIAICEARIGWFLRSPTTSVEGVDGKKVFHVKTTSTHNHTLFVYIIYIHILFFCITYSFMCFWCIYFWCAGTAVLELPWSPNFSETFVLAKVRWPKIYRNFLETVSNTHYDKGSNAPAQVAVLFWKWYEKTKVD